MRSLSIAATGMLAQQRNVEVVSNNLANMNTTAYMRRRTEFQDLLYQNLRRVGTTSSDTGTIVPSGVQLGLGVKLAAVYRIHEQQILNVFPSDEMYVSQMKAWLHYVETGHSGDLCRFQEALKVQELMR